MKKKKSHLSTIILILVFLIGVSVMLYPTVSNYINQFSASRAITNYEKAVGGLSQEEYDRLFQEAQAYNRSLAQAGRLYFVNGEPADAAYQSLLNVGGDGMMGYIEIKKLGVTLPIYHGTSEKTLEHDAGHLEGSSLPVGGADTHAVITGHRGLPTAKLFTDLDRMEVGDTFQVMLLNQTLTYEVDQITIVLPEEVSGLSIIPGEDHVTLVTCTPYAVNTHRLLVRGVRIDDPDSFVKHVPADAIQIDPLMVAPVIAAPFLVALLLALLFGGGKKAARRRREKKNPDPQDEKQEK